MRAVDHSRQLQAMMGTFLHRDPFPPRMRTTHQYSANINVLGTAAYGIIGTPVVLGINDVYTTNGTTTHQPYGRDQMAALYATSKVHACNIELEICGDNANSGICMIAIQNPNAGNAFSGVSIDAADEEPTVSCLLFAPNNPTRTVSRRVDIAKLCCITKQEFLANLNAYAADNFHAPTQRCTLVLGAASCTAGAQCSLTVMVKLEFEVEWFDRIIQGQS